MNLRSISHFALCAALLAGAGLACRKPKVVDPYAGRTAASLLSEGEGLLQTGQWEDGRKILRVIEDRLPSSVEFPTAKLLIAESYFFGSTTTLPEALVEYKSFLNYFPRHEKRDYVLYRIALCHYGAIENAERDQTETRQALTAFQTLLREAPGSVYAVDARNKVTQCWRRIAESELLVGIFMEKNYQYAPAEKRIKDVLEAYPEYVDRERAYYYLGETMRQKVVPPLTIVQFARTWLDKGGVESVNKLPKSVQDEYAKALSKLIKDETTSYREEAKGYYRKLVESYPKSEWAARANDRLLEMGQAGWREELDS